MPLPLPLPRHCPGVLSFVRQVPDPCSPADFRAIPHSTTEAQEDFEAAAEEAKTLSPEPTDEDKLVLYGLFKQATVGDVNTGACGLSVSGAGEARSLLLIATMSMPLCRRHAVVTRLASGPTSSLC